MLRIHAALCEFTGSREMSVFHTLPAGNIGQFGAPGTGTPAAGARGAGAFWVAGGTGTAADLAACARGLAGAAVVAGAPQAISAAAARTVPSSHAGPLRHKFLTVIILSRLRRGDGPGTC
jgi:hypothetical protein